MMPHSLGMGPMIPGSQGHGPGSCIRCQHLQDLLRVAYKLLYQPTQENDEFDEMIQFADFKPKIRAALGMEGE